MKKVIIVVIGSILIGILAGIVTRNLLIGIGLPVILVIFSVMMFAVNGGSKTEKPKEEEKKDDTFHRG